MAPGTPLWGPLLPSRRGPVRHTALTAPLPGPAGTASCPQPRRGHRHHSPAFPSLDEWHY